MYLRNEINPARGLNAGPASLALLSKACICGCLGMVSMGRRWRFTPTVKLEEKLPVVANRKGLGHLAFGVDNVREKLQEVIAHGGRAVGEVVTTEVPGAGWITFCYAADPEGNLLELQAWS